MIPHLVVVITVWEFWVLPSYFFDAARFYHIIASLKLDSTTLPLWSPSLKPINDAYHSNVGTLL